MAEHDLPIRNPRQLKDWINNLAKKNHVAANTILQNYMLERFLERIALSEYRDNFILKGGFLIAAMVGIDMRSTMDMDTTIKGLPVSETEIKKIISDIINVPVEDNVYFELQSIKAIHEISEYDDFRINLVANFFTMRVHLKIDVTTGDIVIPREVDYHFKLMFEERSILVKAYNLNTILAEKVESILVRNVLNTRARDFYDVYILLNTRQNDIDKMQLQSAILKKAEERGTVAYIKEANKYIRDMKESSDLKEIWDAYKNNYTYAREISFNDIMECIAGLFETKN